VKLSSTPTFSRFGSDPRDPPPDLTTSSFPTRITSLDLHSQPFNLSPRVFPANTSTDSKTHHRQTSIVHGIQHSRDGSFASSSNSPLSPQIIAAAGAGRTDASIMSDTTFAPSLSGMTNGTSFSSSTTVLPERTSSAADSTNYNSTVTRVERMHSGRSSRDHRHHHSHSRHHHKDELKTVGEYALHVLFTSVSSFFTVYLHIMS
jgi:hypothetical protein